MRIPVGRWMLEVSVVLVGAGRRALVWLGFEGRLRPGLFLASTWTQLCIHMGRLCDVVLRREDVHRARGRWS